MDFFQNQENAQRKTSLLVFYYVLAVALIIVGIYATIVFLFRISADSKIAAASINFWNPNLFFLVSGITLLVVLLGTLYKVNQLSGGGKSVADLLGAVPVNPQTNNPEERRLLNIVEEMSIASGVQIPQTVILRREEGINAFAAGFTQDDAVVGVTDGCLQSLSRDQLQGVIAHEFSHILHGDMKINIKLMGVLHGILIIAFLGYAIMRSMLFAPRRRSSGKGGSPLPIILLGLALIIIGYIGVFFGNLIKSAVSRQREYLADSSAVQFTRNPSGIAGALKKIAGMGKIPMQCKKAQEANHLFFNDSISGFMSGLLSTHPPIQERIKRLDPAFSGKIEKSTVPAGASSPVSGFAGRDSKLNIQPQNIVSSIGTTQPEHIKYAAKTLEKIPDFLINAAHNPLKAEYVVYSLLFSKDKKIKEKQSQQLKQSVDKLIPESESIFSMGQTLPVEYRISLLDITISTLKVVFPQNQAKIKENIQAMIKADGKVSLFEYTVYRMALRHLKSSLEKSLPAKVKYHSLKPLKPECGLLLSFLAHYGIDQDDKKISAFSKAAEKINVIGPSDFLPKDKCSLKKLDLSLEELDKTSYREKKKIVDACVTCIIADGWITVREAELIRAITDAIGCPTPPLFPGEKNDQA